jgi:hypothetical protein
MSVVVGVSRSTSASTRWASVAVLERTMGVLSDLRNFVRQHGSCGVLSIHLDPPAESTYSIEISCRRCEAGLVRTVDADAAAWDLVHTDLLLAMN